MFLKKLNFGLNKSISRGLFSKQQTFSINSAQITAKRLASSASGKTLTSKVPHKKLKNVGAITLTTIAAYFLYLDQTYQSRKSEAAAKKTTSTEGEDYLKRKTKKLKALMTTGEIPSTVNFLFGEVDIPNTYNVDVLKVLNYYLNNDETSKFSSFLREIMSQKGLKNVEDLCSNLPVGFLSMLISKFITEQHGAINSSVQSITISNSQYISLDEVLKFEIDFAEIDELLLKKDAEKMNESVAEYFDTVDKLRYL